MHILIISVVQREEDNLIQLNFESIQLMDDLFSYPELPTYENWYLKFGVSFSTDWYLKFGTIEFQDNYKEVWFNAYLEKADTKSDLILNSVSFELPRDPKLAFELLNRLEQFIAIYARGGWGDKENHGRFDYITIQDKRLESSLVNNTLACPLLTYLNPDLPDKTTLFQDLINTLLACQKVPGYQETMQVIPLFKEPAFSVSRIGCLLDFARSLIRSGRQAELNHMISMYHWHIKQELILPHCIRAREEQFFEKCIQAFIRRPFFLLSDGRMAMSVGKLFKAQIECYSPWLTARGFAESIQKLANSLGLELALDNDFKDRVIFTSESSNQLKRMGFHLDLNYVKQLLFTRNQLAFFTACSSVSPCSSTLVDTSQEVIDMVVRQIPSPLNRLTNNKELKQAVKQMLNDKARYIQPEEDEPPNEAPSLLS